MYLVAVRIVRFVDAAQPGWVECTLKDAWGRVWVFVEKVPVVAEDELDETSRYPQEGVVPCEVVRRWKDDEGRELCAIDTRRPWGVEAVGGETRFDILAEQIIDG